MNSHNFNRANVDESNLLDLLHDRHVFASEFLTTYPDLEEVINVLLRTETDYPNNSIFFSEETHLVNTFIGLMWQQATTYRLNSLISIIERNLDIGFALLRMAIELSRDANVIGKNHTLFDLWKERETNYNDYRKKFKFNRSKPVGKVALNLYKLTSKLGIHGHMTTLSHASLETSTNEKYATLQMGDDGIFSGLSIWIRSYYPINDLFFDAFDLYQDTNYKIFLDLVETLDPLLEQIDKRSGI